MIKIVHYKIEQPLTLEVNSPQLLVVESPTEFYSVVSQMIRQFNGEQGDFVFLQNDKQVDCNKEGHIVVDPFNIDFNDKKLLNLLYKKLEKNFNQDTFILQYNQINAQLSAFLQDLCFTVPFALEYDEISLQGMFKESVLKFQKTYDTFLEKIVCYINLLVGLKGCKFFVFVNLKSVLNKDQIELLYNHCQNEKVALLLIESTQPKYRLPCEKMTIITLDLCEIVANCSDID